VSGPRSERLFSEDGFSAFRRLPPRPKEPPPPPPPVAAVLLPVNQPRKFMPFFTNNELNRINDVINGRVNSLRHNDDVIKEEEEEEAYEVDEFSSDEFSDGEFDSLSNTYENLVMFMHLNFQLIFLKVKCFWKTNNLLNLN